MILYDTLASVELNPCWHRQLKLFGEKLHRSQCHGEGADTHFFPVVQGGGSERQI